MEMPTYFLFRDIPPGEPFDPTSPPQFFPPKDSDELFDALRAKYPHVKTHSERMRDAIIEFLLEERDSELRAKTHSPAIPATTATTSPWQQSWPSMSSASEPSLFSSPDLFDLATPSFDASPSADMVPTLPARCPSEASPRALEDMTGVFSLSSAQQQPKQKTRRKMTEAEKVEYRKRRIVKACDKCSKRKRKVSPPSAWLKLSMLIETAVSPQPARDGDASNQKGWQGHQASVCGVDYSRVERYN